MMHVKIIDPSSRVRYETSVDLHLALLALSLALAAVFALNLLLAPSRRVARAALAEKLGLLIIGVLHMFFSRDKAYKLSKQPDADLLEQLMTEPMASKRVILIRHGESLWNAVFNKSPMLLMPLRLARALAYEFLVLFELDSVLFDSPLSALGRSQARELAEYLARARDSPLTLKLAQDAQRDISAMAGATSSVVVSSMLRRAVSTAWIALEDRVRQRGPQEPMYLHSAMQEMSRNVDTLSIAALRAAPALSVVNGDNMTVPNLARCTSAQFNAGNKPVRAVALTRIAELAEWCHARPEETIVLVGHSLLFRTLFQLYLPKKSEHVSKAKKVVNCGVVGFTLQQGKLPSGKTYYRIDPASITVVYGGFGGK